MIKSIQWLPKMREERFTVPFQHAFQLSLGADEVAKEMRNTFMVPCSTVSNHHFITKRMRRHLLSSVSAQCDPVKKKMIL